MRSPSSSSAPKTNGWSSSVNVPVLGVAHELRRVEARRGAGADGSRSSRPARSGAAAPRQVVLREEARRRASAYASNSAKRLDVGGDEPRHGVDDLVVGRPGHVDAEARREAEVLRDAAVRPGEHHRGRSRRSPSPAARCRRRRGSRSRCGATASASSPGSQPKFRPVRVPRTSAAVLGNSPSKWRKKGPGRPSAEFTSGGELRGVERAARPPRSGTGLCRAKSS